MQGTSNTLETTNTTNKDQEEPESLFDPTSVKRSASNCRLFMTFASLAGPSIVTCMLTFFCNFVMVLFAARMPDSINVAAIGLACSFTGIMMLSFLVGINTA